MYLLLLIYQLLVYLILDIAPGTYDIPGSIGNKEIFSKLTDSPKFSFGKNYIPKRYASNSYHSVLQL